MNQGDSNERIEPAPSQGRTRIEPFADQSGNSSHGRWWAYFILRLSLGVDMFMHYIVREFGISQDFVPVTEKMFIGNLLPMWLVHYFLTILPYFEAVLGVLLLFGLWTHWALKAEGLLVTVLLFGTALRSDWTVVSHQMIYLLFVYLLLAMEQDDHFSLDTVLSRRRRK